MLLLGLPLGTSTAAARPEPSSPYPNAAAPTLGGLQGEKSLFVFSPDERFVYILGIQTQSLLLFNYDASTEKLAYLDTYEEGIGGVRGLIGARALALSRDGAYIYVLGRDEEVRVVFERNPDTGKLQPAWSSIDHKGVQAPSVGSPSPTDRALEVARLQKRRTLLARQVTEFRPRQYLA